MLTPIFGSAKLYIWIILCFLVQRGKCKIYVANLNKIECSCFLTVIVENFQNGAM